METAMLLLGVLIGCMASLLLFWSIWRHGRGVEPFFLRLLQQENRAEGRIDTRLMLHELLRKVADLTAKTQRMDLELQELKELFINPVPKATVKTETKSNLPEEVSRLAREGLSTDEIACRVQLGRGEVELLLSLDRKPDWVVKRHQNR